MKTKQILLIEQPKQLEIMVTPQDTENRIIRPKKWDKLKTYIKAHKTVYITTGAVIIGAIVGGLIVASAKNKEIDDLVEDNADLDAQNYGRGLELDLALDRIDELEGELTNLHENYSWVNNGKGL